MAWDELSPTVSEGRETAMRQLKDAVQVCMKAGGSDATQVARDAIALITKRKMP